MNKGFVLGSFFYRIYQRKWNANLMTYDALKQMRQNLQLACLCLRLCKAERVNAIFSEENNTSK